MRKWYDCLDLGSMQIFKPKAGPFANVTLTKPNARYSTEEVDVHESIPCKFSLDTSTLLVAGSKYTLEGSFLKDLSMNALTVSKVFGIPSKSSEGWGLIIRLCYCSLQTILSYFDPVKHIIKALFIARCQVPTKIWHNNQCRFFVGLIPTNHVIINRR